MERSRAVSEVVCRARDFASWTNEDERIGHNPFSPGEERTAEYVNECASFVRANLPVVGSADPHAWQKGGRKRADLEEAFEELGYPPLEWDPEKEEFIRSEAAVILAKNEGLPSSQYSIPGWITEDQKEQFRQLSEEELARILEYDAHSRRLK